MLVDIWGKKIWYEIYGTEYNDTLLYLHGGPGASCLDFVNQAKALSEKIKVVIFDQLGVLRSEAIAETARTFQDLKRPKNIQILFWGSLNYE